MGCEIITTDIASVEGCEKLISQVLSTTSNIDILVNSAGVALIGPVLEYSAEDWDRTMAINLRAPFLLAKGLAPGMIEAKAGKIINISSTNGCSRTARSCCLCLLKRGAERTHQIPYG